MKAVGMVDGCSCSQVKLAIKKANAHTPWRAQWAIMTPIEIEKLVKWVILSAENDNPASARLLLSDVFLSGSGE